MYFSFDPVGDICVKKVCCFLIINSEKKLNRNGTVYNTCKYKPTDKQMQTLFSLDVK